jgi:hypothetical protein
MVIDFRKIEAKSVDDKKVIIDISKTLGNTIYTRAMTEEEMKFGKEIFEKGEIELNKPRALAVKKYLDSGGFYAFVKVAIKPVLEKILNGNVEKLK